MFNKLQKENVPSITVGIQFRMHCDLLVSVNFAEWKKKKSKNTEIRMEDLFIRCASMVVDYFNLLQW
jgi:hypothetical protein